MSHVVFPGHIEPDQALRSCEERMIEQISSIGQLISSKNKSYGVCLVCSPSDFDSFSNPEVCRNGKHQKSPGIMD